MTNRAGGRSVLTYNVVIGPDESETSRFMIAETRGIPYFSPQQRALVCPLPRPAGGGGEYATREIRRHGDRGDPVGDGRRRRSARARPVDASPRHDAERIDLARHHARNTDTQHVPCAGHAHGPGAVDDTRSGLARVRLARVRRARIQLARIDLAYADGVGHDGHHQRVAFAPRLVPFDDAS